MFSRAVTDRFVFFEEGDLRSAPNGIDMEYVEASVIQADVRVEMEADDMERGNYRISCKKMFSGGDALKVGLAKLGIRWRSG